MNRRCVNHIDCCCTRKRRWLVRQFSGGCDHYRRPGPGDLRSRPHYCVLKKLVSRHLASKTAVELCTCLQGPFRSWASINKSNCSLATYPSRALALENRRRTRGNLHLLPSSHTVLGLTVPLELRWTQTTSSQQYVRPDAQLDVITPRFSPPAHVSQSLLQSIRYVRARGFAPSLSTKLRS